MSVLILLIAVSLALSAAFVAACIMSIRSGQFDDLESPRWRMLFADTNGGFDPVGDPAPVFTSTSGQPVENQSRIARHDPH
jgi:cbb3-type cytochrome oxidase maturation protein